MQPTAFIILLGLGLAAAPAPLAPAAPPPSSPAPLSKLRPVPFTQVQIRDSFWAPRQETNRVATIPVNLAMLEKSGNIRNFELAAAKATNGFSGPVFMDSDVYKALESASYSLATHPDRELEARLDEIIAKLAAAQQPDGYLDTYYVVKEPGNRWTNLRDCHELYCAGHLFEAAVAHFQATGKRNFLTVATKLGDHIDSVFGPGKRMGYPGHPEIELALVKLSRVTGEQRYFNLARFFIENRGRKFFAEEHKESLASYDGTYWQDDVPIFEHKRIKGHAVRAAYLLSGTTDVARETGDERLLRMINRVWRNTTERNMYVTGGIGPSASNEGFTVDYDLPNLSAYQETCASVALAQWNYRLALLYGEARYADVFERSLYNGALAGVSLDGTRFFYVNPLESAGNHHRSKWFGCACCPPNISRTLASLGGYAYATSEDGLWVNLYVQGSVKAKLNGQDTTIAVTTEYPWDGKVVLKPRLEKPSQFALHLRVPGWCKSPTLSVNGKKSSAPLTERGYWVVDRTWRRGDVVELNLPMPVERIQTNPNVKEDAGLLAIQRGPLVYCLEGCDNGPELASMYLPAGAELKAEKRPALLGGVVVITGFGEIAEQPNQRGPLYQVASATRRVPVTAVPYHAWDNRAAGRMKVWLPIAPTAPVLGGPERFAEVKVSFANYNCQPSGINDGIEPNTSHDHPGALCHWWPHKNTEEWAQYTWKQPLKVEGVKVYWFEDEPSGGACRLPVSWKIEYLEGGEWKAVDAKTDYTVKKDQWCNVSFAPVTTTALRLKLQLQAEWAAGVQEWRVVESEEE